LTGALDQRPPYGAAVEEKEAEAGYKATTYMYQDKGHCSSIYIYLNCCFISSLQIFKPFVNHLP
jgi:hypothetical protein